MNTIEAFKKAWAIPRMRKWIILGLIPVSFVFLYLAFGMWTDAIRQVLFLILGYCIGTLAWKTYMDVRNRRAKRFLNGFFHVYVGDEGDEMTYLRMPIIMEQSQFEWKMKMAEGDLNKQKMVLNENMDLLLETDEHLMDYLHHWKDDGGKIPSNFDQDEVDFIERSRAEFALMTKTQTTLTKMLNE